MKSHEKGARVKLVELFKNNVGKEFSKKELAEVAGIFDWARVIRALRQEGYDIELLKSGSYRLNSLTKKRGNVRGAIDAKTRYRILHRDQSKCQRCGKTPADGIKLVVDHKIPVEYGGKTEDDNLWTLCEECNLGKKHWLSDSDAELMTKIFAQPSTYKRLLLYFKSHPNILIDPSKLAVMGVTREWTRELRKIRAEEKMNIKYITKDAQTGKEGYIYIQEN